MLEAMLERFQVVRARVEREDQSEGAERDLALLASFKQTDFSTPPAAKPIKLFLRCGAPPCMVSVAMLTSSDI